MYQLFGNIIIWFGYNNHWQLLIYFITTSDIYKWYPVQFSNYYGIFYTHTIRIDIILVDNFEDTTFVIQLEFDGKIVKYKYIHCMQQLKKAN